VRRLDLHTSRRRALAGLGLIGALALSALVWPPRQAAEALGASSPLTASPEGRRLALSFASNFADFRSDLAEGRVWRTKYGDGRQAGEGQRTIASNGEMQLYVDPRLGAEIGAADLDPFRVADGDLAIVAKPTPPDLVAKLWGRPYESGVVTTQPSFSQLYGYFEARVKLPEGKGLWPAIWMLPADLSWPPEIDIMESIGDPLTAYMSIHSKTDGAFTQTVKLPDKGFHTYAVSWGPQTMIFYVDGVEAARWPTPADMHKPMYMIANLAVGGQWPGAPDASTQFPAAFVVQFIRAYRFV
jgi:beta-glucanase (GH16 family)